MDFSRSKNDFDDEIEIFNKVPNNSPIKAGKSIDSQDLWRLQQVGKIPHTLVFTSKLYSHMEEMDLVESDANKENGTLDQCLSSTLDLESSLMNKTFERVSMDDEEMEVGNSITSVKSSSELSDISNITTSNYSVFNTALISSPDDDELDELDEEFLSDSMCDSLDQTFDTNCSSVLKRSLSIIFEEDSLDLSNFDNL